MVFNDLREFIQKVDQMGECKTIEGANWESDIGTISELLAEMPNPPLLLFDRIEGYPRGFRVTSNMFATPRRVALALGLPLEAKGAELVKTFKDKIKAVIELIPPEEVKTGPVKENIHVGDDVNLFEFPVPQWHELDGGRYIGTGSVTVMKDPDEGWINVGTYRVQVHDKTTVTLTAVPGHDGHIIAEKYWDKGLPCPVAISCGQEPLLFCASAWERVPWGVSEYDFAGGLGNKPIQVTRGVTTDLPIPATAEIVLEGEFVSPEVESRLEGPFGENLGYYGSASSVPVVRVKSVLHRNDPIIQGNPPSRFPNVWTLGRHFQKAAVLWNELEAQITGVMGVRMVEDASMHSMVIISIKQQYEGHARQAALIAAGSSTTRDLRFIIVVDDDIDPFNISQVLWALGTRCEPADSIDIIKGLHAPPTFPMQTPEMKQLGITEQSLAIIIACKPYRWIKDFPPGVRSSPERIAKTKEKWKELFEDT